MSSLDQFLESLESKIEHHKKVHKSAIKKADEVGRRSGANSPDFLSECLFATKECAVVESLMLVREAFVEAFDIEEVNDT